MGRNITWMGDGRRAYKLLLGKPLGRLKMRWKDNIMRDLKEVHYEDDWKALAQDRVT